MFFFLLKLFFSSLLHMSFEDKCFPLICVSGHYTETIVPQNDSGSMFIKKPKKHKQTKKQEQTYYCKFAISPIVRWTEKSLDRAEFSSNEVNKPSADELKTIPTLNPAPTWGN